MATAPPIGPDAGEDDLAPIEVPPDVARREALLARVYALDDFLGIESHAAEPLLGPLVRRGCRTIIGGYGGHGKSTMGLAMVKAILSGGEMLGVRGAGGCRALVVDLEQGVTLGQKALLKAFYGPDYEEGESVGDLLDGLDLGPFAGAVTYADWQEGVCLHEPGPDIEVLEQVIARDQPDVVMIDPVYKLFLGSDTNENVVIGSFVREIDRLRAKYGFALILPMHPRKPPNTGGTFTMHDLYGSAIWSWWAEVVLLVRRTKEKGTEFIFAKDRTAELPVMSTWHLDYTPRSGFVRRIGDDEEGAISEGPARTRIWDLLQRGAPKRFTRAEMCKTLGISDSTVERTTKRMMADAVKDKLVGFCYEQGPSNAWFFWAERTETAKAEDSVIGQVMDEFGAVEEGVPW